jgi:hypothetical protein
MSLDIWLTVDVDTGGNEPYEVKLFEANYTSNVSPMWQKANVYNALYESNGKMAGDILDNLKAWVKFMEENPVEFLPLNPSNGWGDYYGALKFLKDLAEVCEEHPKATIKEWI